VFSYDEFERNAYICPNNRHVFFHLSSSVKFVGQRHRSYFKVTGGTKSKKIGSVRPRVGVSFFWYIVSIGIKIARRIWELGLPRFASPFPRQTAEKFAEHIGYSVMFSQWQWTTNNVRARCVRCASTTGSVQVGRTDWRTAVGFVICEWNERRRERKESEWEWDRELHVDGRWTSIEWWERATCYAAVSIATHRNAVQSMIDSGQRPHFVDPCSGHRRNYGALKHCQGLITDCSPAICTKQCMCWSRDKNGGRSSSSPIISADLNVYKSLQNSADFSTFSRFKRTVNHVDFTNFLRYS